jgi:hypothetical protein
VTVLGNESVIERPLAVPAKAVTLGVSLESVTKSQKEPQTLLASFIVTTTYGEVSVVKRSSFSIA